MTSYEQFKVRFDEDEIVFEISNLNPGDWKIVSRSAPSVSDTQMYDLCTEMHLLGCQGRC